MKIIDQTPFFDLQTGRISLVDRGRAVMSYGAEWLKEVEGQQQVIALMDGLMDKKFTLLHNITPPGMDAIFPIILVGPPGVFVFFVTALTGTAAAKGEQWGRITAGAFRDEKPNLLMRTERMGSAIRIFLRKHGFSDEVAIDTALLCSNPAFNVDCIRPAVRVVMRDALEHYAASFNQAAAILSPETVHSIVQAFIQEPRQPSTTGTSASQAMDAEPVDTKPFVSAFPQTSIVSKGETDQQASRDLPLESLPGAPESLPGWEVLPPEKTFIDASPPEKKKRLRKRMKSRQRFLLIALFLAWCVLIAVFLFLVFRDQGLSLQSLLP